jgi:hypothetical protein
MSGYAALSNINGPKVDQVQNESRESLALRLAFEDELILDSNIGLVLIRPDLHRASQARRTRHVRPKITWSSAGDVAFSRVLYALIFDAMGKTMGSFNT